MRVTIAIDDDVLLAAKAQAALEERSLGAVISELARRSLQRPSAPAQRVAASLRGRFAMLPARQEVVTVERVRRLMGIGGA